MPDAVEQIIETYIDRYPEMDAMLLLKALAHPSMGGMGYRIETFNPTIDMNGYDVDTRAKVIRLDTRSFFGSNYSNRDLAARLKDAIDIDVFERRHSLMYRVGWGSTQVVLGAVETAVGVVGIIVPEPGTTAGGVLVTTLGVNTVTAGITQLMGANQGEGYNILGEGSAWVGSRVAELAGGDPARGAQLGRIGFAVTSLAVGTVASIRILRVPGRPMLRNTGPSGGSGAGLGRIDLMYGSAPNLRAAYAGQGSMTVFSLNTNGGQSFLRVVVQAVDGQAARLYFNGRLIGPTNRWVLRHESGWRTVAKGLAQLLYHGAKTGW